MSNSIVGCGSVTGRFLVGDVLAQMAKLESKSVDLIVGSPPYSGKWKRYCGLSSELSVQQNWASWFASVMTAASRVTRGYAFFVVNGSVKMGVYDCAVEEAVVRARQRGVQFDRPLIWHKNAPPNRKDYFGNDWEFVIAVRGVNAKQIPFDWEAIATPPKYAAGGDFRQRGSDGVRRKGGKYPKNKLTRPRDVLRVLVGGGQMGSKLAHESEAPFPEKLVEPLIKAFCPMQGTVLDPFMGSGTTAAVAVMNHRNWIGIDVRESQKELTVRRVSEAGDRMWEASRG